LAPSLIIGLLISGARVLKDWGTASQPLEPNATKQYEIVSAISISLGDFV